MEFLEKYISNTYAGSANQLYFEMEENEIRIGRVFYKIAVGGTYNYSLLFSNTIDSTYSDGTVSRKNLICDTWKIHSARIGKCKNMDLSKDITKMTMADESDKSRADIFVCDFKNITFSNKTSKEVMPGELFCSDPVSVEYEKDEYLCLEIEFSGKMIPYHEESLLPVYVKKDGKWQYSKQMPFAQMVGCDRAVEKRVAYFGDSITQGIGTKINSYKHWNALLSEKIGKKYAFWNLGIGYGRASDAASCGAWLKKAKQNDIVFVCFGVNDILQGESEENIKKNLDTVAEALKRENIKVIFQTVPPFDYSDEDINKWENINNFIKTVLASKVDFVFDNVSVLGNGKSLSRAKYGPHPNEEGCRIWAQALYEEVKKYI